MKLNSIMKMDMNLNGTLRGLRAGLLAAGLVISAGLNAEEPNQLTAEERAAGWELLFDGKTTQGWRNFRKADFPQKGWVVENGSLKHEAKGGGGDIITAAAFDDFDFRFEWKIAPGANSGVKYFIMEERGSAIGHEYQVIDDEKHADGKRGGRWQTAGFYDVLAPDSTRPKPPGEWNQSRILARGNQVEHWLNGRKVLEYELGSPEVKKAVAESKFKDVAGFGTKVRGHLLLQDHGDEVHFRNLKIRTKF